MQDWAEERAELARQLSSMRQQRDAALAQAGRLGSLEVQNANLVEQLTVLKKERDSLARQVNECVCLCVAVAVSGLCLAPAACSLTIPNSWCPIVLANLIASVRRQFA